MTPADASTQAMGRRTPGHRVACLSLLVLGLLTSACSPPKPAAPPPAAGKLWGDMTPVVSVKELMRDLLDPLSDNIFDSVKTVVTDKGTVDIVPTTDEDWAKIRIGAVAMAEASYLLKIPRPFAPPGDLNNSTGPEAVELSPAQITAKVEADPVEWNARVETLRNVGRQVLEIVKKKDVQALWDAGQNLDDACENCHRAYWYPKEDAEFYRKLTRRVEEYEKERAAKQPAAPQKR